MTVVLAGHYLGGHPACTVPYHGMKLIFDEKGVALMRRRQEWIRVSGGDVIAIHVEGHGEMTSRVTATRLVLTGPFALAMPKTSAHRTAFVTVETRQGDIYMRIDNAEPHAVAAQLSPFIKRVRGRGARAQPSKPAGIAEQIAQLAALRDSGALTDREFAAAKERLLAGPTERIDDADSVAP